MPEKLRPNGICWDCGAQARPEVIYRQTRTEAWWKCKCSRRWPVQECDDLRDAARAEVERLREGIREAQGGNVKEAWDKLRALLDDGRRWPLQDGDQDAWSSALAACEHRNTLDPAAADPGYVVWCVDCGALNVQGEWRLPGGE